MADTSNILKDKSTQFGILIVKMVNYIQTNKREYVMTKQILRSGTSIGANIFEAQFAQSRPDFINKLSIGLKEASETIYWLLLLYSTQYIEQIVYERMDKDCKDILSLLVASINTSKKKLRPSYTMGAADPEVLYGDPNLYQDFDANKEMEEGIGNLNS
ncbi:MAG: four helix bundle protein [Bacteroidales bacterium]|nr:four helix bundle protein [Bacteroidales bacterium]